MGVKLEKIAIESLKKWPFLVSYLLLGFALCVTYWPWLQLRMLKEIEPPNKQLLSKLNSSDVVHKLLVYHRDIPPVSFPWFQKQRFFILCLFGAVYFRFIFIRGQEILKRNHHFDEFSWLFMCITSCLIYTLHPIWLEDLLNNSANKDSILLDMVEPNHLSFTLLSLLCLRICFFIVTYIDKSMHTNIERPGLQFLVCICLPITLIVFTTTREFSYCSENSDLGALWIRGHDEWRQGKELEAIHYFTQGFRIAETKAQKEPFLLMKGKVLMQLTKFEVASACFHSGIALRSGIEALPFSEDLCEKSNTTNLIEGGVNKEEILDLKSTFLEALNQSRLIDGCYEARSLMLAGDDLLLSSLNWLGHSLVHLNLTKAALACFNSHEEINTNLEHSFSTSVNISKITKQTSGCENLLQLGQTSLQFGLFEEALATFTKALELDNSCWKSYFYRGITLKYLRRFSSARNSLKKSIKLNSTDYKAMYEISMSYIESEEKDFEKSLTWIQKAINAAKAVRLGKAERLAYEADRCNIILNHKKTRDFLREVIECCDVIMHEADIWYEIPQASFNHRGIALVHLNQVEKARESFLAGLQLSTRMVNENRKEYNVDIHSDAYNNLGVLEQTLGNNVPAVIAYRNALKLNKRNTQAKANLEHLTLLPETPTI